MIGTFTMDGAGIIKKEWKLNSTLGRQNVFVYVDSENYIAESNEKDNSASISFIVEKQPNIPIAIAGQDSTGTPGVPLQFSGAGIDENGTIV